MANPCETDPEKIPSTDLYADAPCYGRYCPSPDDFRVALQHVQSETADSLSYWASVLDLCTEENRICPGLEGGRDVFALGSVIVKSSHLQVSEGDYTEKDFSCADANEIEAVKLARTVLKEVRVPEIYFAGKVMIIIASHLLNINRLTPLLDQWPPSACPRTAPRRWTVRRMAVPLSRPEEFLQRAGPQDTPATSYDQAHNPSSLACGTGPKHTQQRSSHSAREGDPLLTYKPGSRHEFHA